MTTITDTQAIRRGPSPGFRKALPYLLSLPALLVCVGVLVPFVTAVYYSLLRYRLNLPGLKGFIWFGNYVQLLSDVEFWNTVWVSLLYTLLTVVVELLLGLGIAMLLRQRSRSGHLKNFLLAIDANQR